MTTVEVSLTELAEIRDNSGEVLHDDGPFPVVYVKGTTYWARPVIPQQRQPEARGPLNTPPVPAPSPAPAPETRGGGK